MIMVERKLGPKNNGVLTDNSFVISSGYSGANRMPEPLPQNLFQTNPIIQRQIEEIHRVQPKEQQPIPTVDPLASKGYSTLQRGQWVKH